MTFTSVKNTCWIGWKQTFLGQMSNFGNFFLVMFASPIIFSDIIHIHSFLLKIFAGNTDAHDFFMYKGNKDGSYVRIRHHLPLWFIPILYLYLFAGCTDSFGNVRAIGEEYEEGCQTCTCTPYGEPICHPTPCPPHDNDPPAGCQYVAPPGGCCLTRLACMERKCT